MKNTHLALLFGLLISVACGREDVTPYAATESFPNDELLGSISSKKAMIIIAHDDDMCAMSGTISKLNKTGWDIRVISFPKDESRNNAQRRACKNILDTVLFFDISEQELRRDTAKLKYNPIPKSEFSKVYNETLVAEQLIAQIRAFGPSIIFTLDSDIGGYGHPDHVFISQLTLDLARWDSISPQYIYQSVYTDHMESTIMDRHSRRMKSWGFAGDGWEKAKEAYQVEGMPEPTVQINITEEANTKMDYLLSYNERERKTMGFFIPAFQEYSAEEYFSIFDREFYRVIKL